MMVLFGILSHGNTSVTSNIYTNISKLVTTLYEAPRTNFHKNNKMLSKRAPVMSVHMRIRSGLRYLEKVFVFIVIKSVIVFLI